MKILQLLLLCFCCRVAMAQPTEPILRIETGMHSATANRIATDTAGEYLLTCSDDKTARLWDAATGKLLHIFRVPIGNVQEGKLYTCALSPDGKVAALAGWTGQEWDKTDCIYLLNTRTGEITNRIKGMQNVIYDLEFSPNGKWLVAGMGLSGGVYVIGTKKGKLMMLNGYGNSVYSMAFNKNNQLATISLDGNVRLYNSSFELINRVSSLPGKLPYSVTFNNLGTSLAIGYDDIPTVEIRSVPELNIVNQPSITGAETIDGGLRTLCFNLAGNTLYGAGKFSIQVGGVLKYAMRLWQSAGLTPYIDVPLMRSNIMDIKALPNGNIAVLGAYPDMAVLSPAGKIIWYLSAPANDYAARRKSHFKINENGVAIGIKPFLEAPLTFDIRSRQLTQAVAAFPSFTDSSAGTAVTGWNADFHPVVNSNPVASLHQNERCRSTDINSDGKKVVLGTDFYLYLCNNEAVKQWETVLPDIAWAVNISGNDKVVAAALGDGTIRWYSMADGKELLAFYLNSDEKRWVLWTPQGYYDASPGAEDFLGWHVNNGPDKAPDFYPISRSRSKYYRPDVIDAIFATYNEDSAINLANATLHTCHPDAAIDQRGILQMLPPVVTITSPANPSNVTGSSVGIHYTVKNPPGAALAGVHVLVNGRPVAAGRGLNISHSADGEDSVLVALPAGECRITLLAENSNGTSPAATLTLTHTCGAAAKPKKPNLYAVVVGISNYDNAGYRLQYAAADAADFTASLKKQKGKKYGDVVVKQLLDKDATESKIQQELEWVQTQAGKDDVAMIFYAGHGMNENNHFYFLPADADISNLYTCLCDTALVRAVSHIAGKVVVFFDACHSGNALSNCSAYTDVNAMINRLMGDENGVVTFTSSTGREYSYEYPGLKHGAFTKALLEGFSGKAAPYSPDITVKTLDAFTSMRVKQLTDDKQHPTMIMPQNLPDFGIGIK